MILVVHVIYVLLNLIVEIVRLMSIHRLYLVLRVRMGIIFRVRRRHVHLRVVLVSSPIKVIILVCIVTLCVRLVLDLVLLFALHAILL